MAATKPRRKTEPPHVPADIARATLGDLLDRAGFSGERIIITRHDKRLAALVSIADLEKLEGSAA